jgi:hypothetical protein
MTGEALRRAEQRERDLRAALTNAACSMQSSATAFDECGQPGQARYLRQRAQEALRARDETLRTTTTLAKAA